MYLILAFIKAECYLFKPITTQYSGLASQKHAKISIYSNDK